MIMCDFINISRLSIITEHNEDSNNSNMRFVANNIHYKSKSNACTRVNAQLHNSTA